MLTDALSATEDDHNLLAHQADYTIGSLCELLDTMHATLKPGEEIRMEAILQDGQRMVFKKLKPINPMHVSITGTPKDDTTVHVLCHVSNLQVVLTVVPKVTTVVRPD